MIIYVLFFISPSDISLPSVLSTAAWKILFEVNPIQTQMARPGVQLKSSGFRIPDFSFTKLHRNRPIIIDVLLLFKNNFWEIL